MAATAFFGVDFGTSNSTFSCFHEGKRRLLPLEADHLTLPSIVFFNTEQHSIHYGREALTEYLQGTEGRLMRSLKSVLGSSLMQEDTRIGMKNIAFADIIGTFIKHLKAQAEKTVKHPIDTIVLGRPVHFVDDDSAADAAAQDQLETIAKAQGFKHIAFQYEPIAAALDYEQDIHKETLALIIDMGGGTSDFSVVRLSPERQHKPDRSDDVLSNHGIHIGGTDFDKALSLHSIMPHLGYKTALREKNLLTPNNLFQDLATWHKINLLYTHKTLLGVKDLLKLSAHPDLIARLLYVLQEHKGHELAMHIEQAKIGLSQQADFALLLECVGDALALELTQQDLFYAITRHVESVLDTITHTIRDAGLEPNQIHTLFLTGGSTLIPMIRTRIQSLCPQAQIVDGDAFGSVGMGLAVDARRRFG